MSKAIQPMQNLSTAANYSYAMNNAAMIGKAISLVEQGKDVADFPKYIEALETLIKRAEARQTAGIHPKLNGAQQKLMKELNGLQQRIAVVAAKAQAAANEPSFTTVATTKIAEMAGKLTLKKAAIIGGVALAAIYAGPELMSLTTKVGAAGYVVLTSLPRLIQGATDTADKVAKISGTAACIAGIPLAGINHIAYKLGLESRLPPQNMADVCGMGVEIVTNAWTTGAALQGLSYLTLPITVAMPALKASWLGFSYYMTYLAIQTALPETTTKMTHWIGEHPYATAIGALALGGPAAWTAYGAGLTAAFSAGALKATGGALAVALLGKGAELTYEAGKADLASPDSNLKAAGSLIGSTAYKYRPEIASTTVAGLAGLVNYATFKCGAGTPAKIATAITSFFAIFTTLAVSIQMRAQRF